MLPNKTVGILLFLLGAFLVVAGIFCLLDVEHFNFDDIFGYSIIIIGVIILLFAAWFYFVIKLKELKELMEEHAARKAAKKASAEKAKAEAKAAAATPGTGYAASVSLGDSNLAKAIKRGAEVVDFGVALAGAEPEAGLGGGRAFESSELAVKRLIKADKIKK